MAEGLSRVASKAGRLQRALLQLIEEHRSDDAMPTGGRFLWYELVSRGVVDKTKARGHPGVQGRGVDQDVTDALTHLRKIELVRWGEIIDETRDLDDHTTMRSVEDGQDEYTATWRLDPWEGLPPLLLVESRQAAGVLERVAYKYRILIGGLGGQVNGYVQTEIAPVLSDDQPVLYLGDRDLAGNQIQTNVERILGRPVERLALTDDQVELEGLEPILKRDRRYSDGRPHWAVELEALGQRTLTDLIDRELSARLPGPLMEAVVQVRTERTVLEHRESGVDDA